MTSVTQTCRDLSELKPNAELACRLLFQQCYKAGIDNIFITETYRSQARQNYLYAQGRTRSGQVVTWTLNSNHTPRLAWDIACSSPSLYDTNTLTKVGNIAMKLGITWGGQPSWVKSGATDRPHFEVSKNWAIPTGYKLENQLIVPSNSKMKVQLIVKDKKDVSKSIGYSEVNNATAYRIQSGKFNTYASMKIAMDKSLTGYLAYAEPDKNNSASNGYRFVSGNYKNNKQLAVNVAIKMLEDGIITYASILGNKE